MSKLPKAFEIHDLGELLMLSGLSRRLTSKDARPVKPNWALLMKTAKNLNDLRYLPGSLKDINEADAFFEQLRNPQRGVIPWILSQP